MRPPSILHVFVFYFVSNFFVAGQMNSVLRAFLQPPMSFLFLSIITASSSIASIKFLKRYIILITILIRKTTFNAIHSISCPSVL